MSSAETKLIDKSVELANSWLKALEGERTRKDIHHNKRLKKIIDDPKGLNFIYRFLDNVARPVDLKVSAKQLDQLLESDPPEFVGKYNFQLLKICKICLKKFSNMVVRFVRNRIFKIIGTLTVNVSNAVEFKSLRNVQDSKLKRNYILLGESVEGVAESANKFEEIKNLIMDPDTKQVSVKLSAIVPKVPYWDYQTSLSLFKEKLSELYRASQLCQPQTFINLDMEEYRDLDLTIDAFQGLLNTEEFWQQDAGIVLQAYLPDSFDVLRELIRWANKRRIGGGGEVKIRLVKGANLSMEKVQAEINSWELTTYSSKEEVDANYKRCVDWAFARDRLIGVKFGIGTHNVFDIAWCYLLAVERKVLDRVDFEMLHGMAPALSRLVQKETDSSMNIYTPLVGKKNPEVSISYLFRRLEEESSPNNFLNALLNLEDSNKIKEQEIAFRSSMQNRWNVESTPKRVQIRPQTEAVFSSSDTFRNEPDTDPVIPSNRRWANSICEELRSHTPPRIAWVDDSNVVDKELHRAKKAQVDWLELPFQIRSRLIRSISDQIAIRRGDLISAMMIEAKKTFHEADAEVSEAIDYANYYGLQVNKLEKFADSSNLQFVPFGVIAVAPPWNYPVAIPAGGILAALSAGNSVIIKPSPYTPICAQILAECCWAAGISFDLLRFLPMPDGDASRQLITGSDAVIFDGSVDVASMFKEWKHGIHLFGETAGKNSIIVTPSADIDHAISDIVKSAFSHAGQKSSSVSIVIGVGGVTDSEFFRNKLIDAVMSLKVGSVIDLGTDIGPCLPTISGNLERALTTLEPGESWLIEPVNIDGVGQLWRPGIKYGVKPNSWFQQTQCFGPVLGIISVENLETAINVQNSTEYSLTGGIHTVSEEEVRYWLKNVEVGNAYVNRATTGSIVQRQPFGGWNRLGMGPGAKSGGRNYIQQLGIWNNVNSNRDQEWLDESARSDKAAWLEEFCIARDDSNLEAEANIFRYRRLNCVAVRTHNELNCVELKRIELAASICGVNLVLSSSKEETIEKFIERLEDEVHEDNKIDRIRVLGSVELKLRQWANKQKIFIDTAPVTDNGFIELQHYLKEQTLSIVNHRFGNVDVPIISDDTNFGMDPHGFNHG